MKKRFTDEQIIGFLKQADGGVPVRELCRQHDFSDASLKQTDISERHACLLVELSRSVLNYAPKCRRRMSSCKLEWLSWRLNGAALAIGAFMPCFGEKVMMSITNVSFASTRLLGWQ